MANLIKGLLASRPAVGTVGRRFSATDTGKLYYDTGSTWEADGPDNALLTVAGGVSTKTSSYAAVLGDSGSLLVLNSGSSIVSVRPSTGLPDRLRCDCGTLKAGISSGKRPRQLG